MHHYTHSHSPVLGVLEEIEEDEEVLMEMRVRLVSGLKRYFHGKRAEGLLSSKGMQILDHACDTAMDTAEAPLAIWDAVEREVG